MNKIRCVIVEDEIPAAEELKYLLSKHENFSVEDIAFNGESGFELIQKIKPDVVFLDINMPMQNGVELAKKISEVDDSVGIVFVTAYDEHAVQAFELDALDYILKPIDDKRLQMTLDRILHRLIHKNGPEDKLPKIISEIMTKLETKEMVCKKIPCEFHGKIVLIDLNDIFYCYIEGEKTYIKTRKECFLTGYTLNQIEKKAFFFRAHRSFLVNLDNVKELFSWFNGTYKLVMNDLEGSEVPISRSNVKRLKELLGI